MQRHLATRSALAAKSLTTAKKKPRGSTGQGGAGAQMTQTARTLRLRGVLCFDLRLT